MTFPAFAGLAIFAAHALQFAKFVCIVAEVTEGIVALIHPLLQFGLHRGAIVAVESVALDGDGIKPLAADYCVDGDLHRRSTCA